MVVELVHFDAARRELALANSIDEVKGIRDKAEAIRQYIKQQKGSFEMQNQAAEIKLRAERRAGELLGDMERNKGGEWEHREHQLQDVTSAPKLEELGISKIQSHRWQTEAQYPEEKFERYVAETKDKGEELTSVALYSLAKGIPHIARNNGNNEWYTPSNIIELARLVMGSIDCDPASNDKANEIVKATKYFTSEVDGRQQKWEGNIWLNPPYAQPSVSDFCHLVCEKYKTGEIRQACVLVNNATETAFYQGMLELCGAVCFIKGRVRFVDEDGKEGAPLQGQTVLYFGFNIQKFADYFSGLGVTLYAR